MSSFIPRSIVTLSVAFLFFPLALVLLFNTNGDGPVSGLDGVLLGWFILFVMQFWLVFLWPIPLAIGLIAAGLWQAISRAKAAR